MHETRGFQTIQERAACTFAPRARIEHRLTSDAPDAREVAGAAYSAVSDFASRVDDQELDGLVIELRDAGHGSSLAALAAAIRNLLAGLIEADGGDPAVALREAGSEHWWLTLCGTRWFVLAFAPCYPASSPRFTYGSSATYVLLQPVDAFDRRATPRGTTMLPAIRERIRADYRKIGCPYDGDLAQQDVEALKFVWPMRLEDPPVRWWEQSPRQDHG